MDGICGIPAMQMPDNCAAKELTCCPAAHLLVMVPSTALVAVAGRGSTSLSFSPRVARADAPSWSCGSQPVMRMVQTA